MSPRVLILYHTSMSIMHPIMYVYITTMFQCSFLFVCPHITTSPPLYLMFSPLWFRLFLNE